MQCMNQRIDRGHPRHDKEIWELREAAKMKKLLALITGVILLFGPGCLPSPAQIGSQVGQVSCKVIGPDGQPLIKVPVVYTNPETGRSYKLKTDKRGEAMGLGLMFGTYQVVISNQAGEKLYDGKTYVGPDQDANAIKIDLSRPASESRIGSPTTQVIAGRDPNAAFGSLGPGIPNMASVGPVDNKKKSKQQEKDQLAKAGATNDLIKQVNVALSARKWSDAATGFQQLIQADPAKLQYYQGLGAVQINLGQYQEAATTFDKGNPDSSKRIPRRQGRSSNESGPGGDADERGQRLPQTE